MQDNKDEYIKYLENKILENTQNELSQTGNNEVNFNGLLRYQEEFLLQKYGEKDWWIYENKRLHDENIRLLKTIMFDQTYINYLLDSFWWKATFPFRFLSRNLKGKVGKKYVEKINLDSNIIPLEIKVSVIIFTYNAGDEFNVQLENLKKQKFVNKIEIIVVDRNSCDNTLKIAKKQNTKIIHLEDTCLNNTEAYLKILPNVTGDYIVVIDQNKIIKSEYWMYQSIKPIFDGEASLTAFFKNDVSVVRETAASEELKNRMCKIANLQVIFFPLNRNIVQYISPFILDQADVIVKKKTSDMVLETVL